LIQTGKIREFPLVLMGKDFWRPMLDFMSERMIKERTIDAMDRERFLVTDSPEEAVASITDIAMKRFRLTYGSRIKKRWLLGERQSV
jgi:predicted Rossmann-fold nucleotide-binding protein